MEKLDSVIVILVLKMKEIVILMMSVKMVFIVDQTIAQLPLVLTLKLIVVINQLLEMKVFVHLEFLVEKMREIVMPIVNVKATSFVDQITAQLILALVLKLTVVLQVKWSNLNLSSKTFINQRNYGYFDIYLENFK